MDCAAGYCGLHNPYRDQVTNGVRKRIRREEILVHESRMQGGWEL